MPPEISYSLISVEEYNQRLDRIIQIRDAERREVGDQTPGFTILEFCHLIRKPLSHLQAVAARGHLTIRQELDCLVELTDCFFQNRSQIRNEAEKARCLDFDNGVCIITGAPNPHVCHISPFEIHECACIDVTDSSDKSWNMICLSPLLYEWWTRGYFALKFHGENANDDGTSSIQLQFFWMPSYIRSGTSSDPINLEQQRDPHTRLEAFLRYPHGENSPTCRPEDTCLMCAEAKQVTTHRPVSTGSIFTVTRATADVPYFRYVISIQWDVICAASFSGRFRDPEVIRIRRDLGLEAPSGMVMRLLF
ncbi:hypothetical protein FALBO_12041 [Fusarium albosuccineum]|uniref:HNH nuclease domain-containing protein n=1 Tax=Fusarium albosuccineum TaxID=1237068 RepID=A0A8H4PHG6_9HYPO|nr:hypothetical protein FALBO_12041 [Fusarium albosuccineum]